MGVATTLCNPPPAQESRRRRSANKEARRHRDNSNAAPITNVFCCYTANFLFVWCCCLCRSRDAQPCGCPPPPPGRSLHLRPPLTGDPVRGIFFFLPFLFSSLPFWLLFFFSSALSPVFSLSPTQRSVNILKRRVAVGGSSDEEDLRNADTAFPRLSGPLPFGASVFFSFYVSWSVSTPTSRWSDP